MDNFTVKKLITVAKKFGLSTKGRKQELIDRISAFEATLAGSVEESAEIVEESFVDDELVKELEQFEDQNDKELLCALCLQSIPKDWTAKAEIEKMVIVLKSKDFPTVPLVLKPSSTCHESSTNICRGCFISNQQLYIIQFRDQVAMVKSDGRSTLVVKNEYEKSIQSTFDSLPSTFDLFPTSRKNDSMEAIGKIPLSPSRNTSMPFNILTDNSLNPEKPKNTKNPRPYKAFDEEDVKTLIRNSPVKSFKRVAVGVGAPDETAPSPAKRSRLYDCTLGQ
jgi:SAP domain